MTRTIAKLGDRLLALVVPEHRAVADECYHQKRCGPYGCTGTMDYKVRQQVRYVCRAAGPQGPWRNTNYCCWI